jgi:hypothetical protein
MISSSPDKDPGINPVFRTWEEASMTAETLSPGDFVVGFETPTDLDIFTDNVSKSLVGYDLYGNFHRDWFSYSLALPDQYLASNSGKKVYDGWRVTTVPPSVAIRPKKFNGDFREITALMLDDTAESTYPGLGPVPKARSFVIFADMHSSGRGVVGKVAKQCTVRRDQQVIIAYDDLPKFSTAEEVAESLQAESQQISREVVVKGLRTIFSGGLPGLGRRK